MLEQLARYDTKLRQLEQKDRRRRLCAEAGVDFSSNDYLGLAACPRLAAATMAALERGVPLGAGGSRLLRGNHEEHEALEAEAAAFFGSERALYFGSGYAANLAVLSTLPQRGDLVLYDALIHASAHAGLKAGRAEAVAVRHNDADACEEAIRRWRQGGGIGTLWIVVESLYSMDGDQAPLQDLMAIADRHHGFLLVDEAHASGVWGPGGRGLAADLEGRENVLVLHTCGKALGVSGAVIAGSAILLDYLVNHAKPFIYSTAPSPLQAASLREALRILREEPERRQRLHRLVRLADGLSAGLLGASSGSQIQPVVVGSNGRAVALAERLRRDGFDVRAIRPPTVPAGTARLRISITCNVKEDDVRALFDHLAAALAEISS
ncbi:8-amino-7-oxononanoate synthase [Ciceribacter sp. RN22]|uniref:8-amino-7-oxononanoate synthase n=1 Tax=Ciceribacter sp. RN22 TaxID=2954932 RepID=UPI0020931F5F|nr:8-amino-7-oxononanoate synthase [Ciceribacter sp. RN22]MCO6176820.1 8-amino-7-oxononanoate synthase [Ciceribacter sp. RN22]